MEETEAVKRHSASSSLDDEFCLASSSSSESEFSVVSGKWDFSEDPVFVDVEDVGPIEP